jgi:hypothetical protein
LHQQAKATKNKEAAEAVKDLAAGMGRLGSSMSKMAGMAGAIMALVKALIDLDAKMKELNREIVKTAGVADFGFSSAEVASGLLGDELAKIRDDLSGLNKGFSRFNANTKEQIAVLSSLNQAGVTFGDMRKEFEKGVEGFKNYDDAVSVVLTYSRALGVNSQEMAKQMGNLTLMTSSTLPQLGEQFSVIAKEAERAGFITQRFYSTILNVTSGMAYYGVRVEETTKLLSTMGTLIGQVYGEDLMKSIAGRQQQSYQENLKDIISKGSGRVGAVMRKQYELRLAQYGKEFKELGNAEEAEAKIRSMVENARSLVELSKMAQEAGVTSAKRLGDLSNLYTMRKGGQGNLAAQTAAMGSMGPGGQTLIELMANQALGGGDIEKVFQDAISGNNAPLLLALEKTSKATGKSRDQLINMATQAKASFDLAKQAAKDDTELNEIQKKLGLSIDRNNKTVMKDGVEISNWKDLFLVQASSEKQVKSDAARTADSAAELASYTKDLYQVMDQAILGVLVDIYNLIASFPGAGGRKRTRDAYRGAQTKALSDQEKAKKELDELKRIDRTTLTGEQKSELDKKIVEKEAQFQARAKEAEARKVQAEIQGFEKGEALDKVAEAAKKEGATVVDVEIAKRVATEMAMSGKAVRGDASLDMYDLVTKDESSKKLLKALEVEGDLSVSRGYTGGVGDYLQVFDDMLGTGVGSTETRARIYAGSLQESGNLGAMTKAFGGEKKLAAAMTKAAEKAGEEESKFGSEGRDIAAIMAEELVALGIVQKTDEFQATKGKVEQAITINQMGGDEAETVRILQKFLDDYFKKR